MFTYVSIASFDKDTRRQFRKPAPEIIPHSCFLNYSDTFIMSKNILNSPCLHYFTFFFPFCFYHPPTPCALQGYIQLKNFKDLNIIDLTGLVVIPGTRFRAAAGGESTQNGVAAV